MFKQSLLDEQGIVSSPRVQSFICTLMGVLAIIAGFVMIAMGVKEVTSYVAVVLGATFGKGASDLWAAQLKSGKVLAAQATAATTPPTTPTPADSASTKADDNKGAA